MIDPAIQQLLQSFLPQQNTATAGIYGGQSDVLNSIFGAATSAAPPQVSHQGNVAAALRSLQLEAMQSNADLRLVGASRLTGMPQPSISALATLLPMAQFGGFREDLYGGGAALAVSRNRLQFLQEGPQAQARAIEDMTQKIYERMTDRDGMPVANLKGTRGTKDMSAVLSYASQTGQMAYGTTNIAGMSEDDMVDAAQRTIERFDTILQAGRKVFGPDTKSSEILRRMRAVAGPIDSDRDAERASAMVTTLANTALVTGGTVEGAMRAQENMRNTLMDMGISEKVAASISASSLNTAMQGYRSGMDTRAVLNEKLGTSFDMMSAEDMHAVQVQQQLRFMGTQEARRSMSTGWLQSQGIDGDRAAGLEALFGGDLHKIMPADLLAKMTEASAARVSLGAGKDRMDFMMSKGLIKGDKDLFSSYTTQRFGGDRDTAKKIREAVLDGDRGALSDILGFQVTKTMLDDMKISEAAALHDFATYSTADVAMGMDTKPDVDLQAEPPPASGDFLNKAIRKQTKARADRINEIMMEKVGKDKFHLKELTGTDEQYEAWTQTSDKDLASMGIVRSYDHDGQQTFSQYMDKDDKKPLRNRVTGALEEAEAQQAAKGFEPQAFIDMLMMALKDLLSSEGGALAKMFGEEVKT